jgi:sialidase-1
LSACAIDIELSIDVLATKETDEMPSRSNRKYQPKCGRRKNDRINNKIPMVNKLPADFLLCLTLDDIGNLDKYAYRSLVPADVSSSLSVAFWFYSEPESGKRVLINVNNVEEDQTGWSFFLLENTLVFRVKLTAELSSQVACPINEYGIWAHASGTVDLQSGLQALYLNGILVASTQLHLDSTQRHSLCKDGQELVVGGYTDPAGGHYDHTFGRNGTGMIDQVFFYNRVLLSEEIRAYVPRTRQASVARFTALPICGEAPLEVWFDAEITEEKRRPIRYCFWDMGDRQKRQGTKVLHRYDYAGDYTVKLTVVDEDYATASATREFSFCGKENPLTFSPVFLNGTEGHAGYRIPSIIRALNGDLLAFAEGRLESLSDSTQTIRLVSKRSHDNGKSWEPLQILARNHIAGDEFVIQHISPVVDAVFQSGRICLVYSKSEHNEWQLARGEGVSRTFCMVSDDHGLTWSEERDITLQIHKPYTPGYSHIYPKAALPENQSEAWRNQRPTLGHAIQLRGTTSNPSTRGRLLYAGTFTRANAGIFNAYNYLFWSDDLGESWEIGGVINSPRFDGTSAQGLDEATAVELEDGSVLVNSRNYQDRHPVGCRAMTLVRFNQNGKASFEPTYHDQTLVCPTVQASMLRLSFADEIEKGRKSRIIFSNPNHSKARYNLTVRLSYDEGTTWPVSKVIDPGPSAYSDLVLQADNRIGVLYERGNQGGVFYASFSLEWLTDEQDAI